MAVLESNPGQIKNIIITVTFYSGITFCSLMQHHVDILKRALRLGTNLEQWQHFQSRNNLPSLNPLQWDDVISFSWQSHYITNAQMLQELQELAIGISNVV